MTDYSNSATVQLLGLGARFRDWCAASIDALISDLAGSADSGGRGPLVAIDGAATTVFGPLKSGERPLLARLDGGRGIAADLPRQLAGRVKGDVILRLGAGKAVISRIVLPAAAMDVLPAVIRNKVESLAPWPLSEARWGYRIAEGQPAGQVQVDVGIVSRASLESMIADLAGCGLKVGQLEIAADHDSGRPIQVDFLAEDRSRGARRKLAAAAFVVVLLALAAGGYGLYQAMTASQDLTTIQSRIDTLRQALQGKRGSVANAKLAAANQLFDRKRDGRPFVLLLNEMTRLVPDGTWLTALNFDGSRMTITGHGSEVPGLVKALEQSETFADVNFAAATQRDPDGNGQTFSISAGIRPKAAPQ